MRSSIFYILFSVVITIGFVGQIKGQCSADFSAPSKLCDKDTASFTFTGTGTSFAWDFDNPASGVNNTDTLANPKHLFTTSGTYNVRLIVSDGSCLDTFIQQIRVLSLPAPNFAVLDNCKSLNTRYTAQIKFDAVDSIGKTYWDFNGIHSDSGQQVFYSFSDTGSKNIGMSVISLNGCSNSFNKNIKVYPKPVIQANKSNVCTDQDVSFSLIQGQVTPLIYNWNFGDGFSSTQASPVYQYGNGGEYKFRLTLRYEDSSTCTSLQDSIKIFLRPISTFRLVSDSIQCFKGNTFCFEFDGRETNLTYRSINYGDGIQNSSFPFGDTSICYSYNEDKGGVYTISLEVIDSNGCSNTSSLTNVARVHKIFDVDFISPNVTGCFQTTANFTNSTNQTPPEVVKFLWNFGDSTVDSTNWNSSKTYTENGVYAVSLWAKNDVGCEDSITKGGSVNNVNFEVNPQLDSVSSTCRSDNRFFFSHPFTSGASIQWLWGDNDTSYSLNPIKRFNNPGVFYPRIRISRGLCSKTVNLDSIIISGPRALAEITNRYQCQIKDTVFFSNQSIFENNQSRMMFWDFGDPFANACTTNQNLGINVGQNCRYSTDSILTKHWYTPGEEDCYRIKLVVKDTIVGCIDSVFYDLPLLPPKADRDITLSPPRLGLNISRTKTCLTGNPDIDAAWVIANISGTQPSCGRQNWWVMWDSLAAAQSGNFNAYWDNRGDSNYYSINNKPADPNGFVTIGLIIQNGSDTNNNVCRDTAWYHNFLQFEMFDPNFTTDYNPSIHYCKNSTFSFRLQDTTQNKISQVHWNFGDGTSITVSSNHTKPISHTYTRSGSFIVRATVITLDGCSAFRERNINIGVFAGLPYTSDSSFFCSEKEVIFNPQVLYHPNSTQFWNDPTRVNASKETLRWNFDDGNGFQNIGLPYKYIFNKAGEYTINIEVKDSTGCLDTFTFNRAITVKYLNSKITLDEDTFVCAQVIPFTAFVTQFDTSSSFAQDTTGEITYKWTFADNLQTNSLPNPFRLLTEGSYNIKLEVTNNIGCSDTSYKSIYIRGPKAIFNFLSDSIGCQPHEIIFKNNSIDASNYIWRFNDSNSTVFNTTSLADIDFLYSRFGKFYPTLTAQGTFTRNGVPITCTSIFPDTSMPISTREVTVLEIPKPEFSYETNCFNLTTQFSNESTHFDSIVSVVHWDFGDGSSSNDLNPMHQFPDTGRFVITLTAFSANGCSDTLRKTIVISPVPEPDFTFDNQCAGIEVSFRGSSKTYNDVIASWRWDFGDSTYSDVNEPVKTYSEGGFYSVKMVVTNLAGCSDSIIKTLQVYNIPIVDFTQTHNCSRADVEFANLSNNADTSFSYKWTFGDGTSSTDETPAKSYTSEGNYAVKLITTSDFGCSDSVQKTVNIIPTPLADFTTNSSSQCFATQQFNFTNNSSISSGNFTNNWSFGDGNTTSNTSPTNTYAGIGSYSVRLIAESNLGCSDTVTKSVFVNQNPSANFSINAPQQCLLGNDFKLTDISTFSGGGLSRNWTIEGNSTYTDSVQHYSFADTGFKSIRLVVSSLDGCTDTAFKTVETVPMPKAAFGINIPEQCVNNQNFQFTDNTTIDKYPTWNTFWNFGNGDTGAGTTDSSVFANAGFYTVSMRVMTSIGCADTISKQIEVYPKPIPAFTIDDDEQCQINNIFGFTNQTTVGKGTLSYLWKFGDGNTSSQTNPQHTYLIFGNPSITLTATSSFNCVDSVSKQVTVRPKPLAQITVNDTQQCINPNFFVFSSNSTSQGGSFVTYEWTIDDFDTTSIQVQDNFEYVFPVHGVFPIDLYVTTEFNCKDSTTLNIEVYPKPQAVFTINDSTQCVNNQFFQFNNQTSIPYGTLTYAWDFGDGKNSTTINPSNFYSVADTFTVEMLATSNQGCKDTTDASLIVYPKPIVNFNINDTGQCLVGNLYELGNLSTIEYGTLSYLWDFYDGRTSTEVDTQINYPVYGTYKILLRAESNFECVDTFARYVLVYPKPAPEFDINQEKQCLNENLFEFTNNGSVEYGTMTHIWRMGDGSTLNTVDATHRYLGIGPYTVQLTSTSEFGCVDSISLPVRVWANPNSAFAANNPAQCINTQQFQFLNQSTIIEGDIVGQKWNLGNGDSSFTKNSNSYFPTSGEYRISLISYSDSGCLDSVINFIDVYPKPTASFDINDTAQCLYTNLFEFTNTSTDTLTIIDRFWILGNDSTAATETTAIKFHQVGYHKIELQVISELGCADTTDREVYVKPMPDPSFEKLELYYCNNYDPISFNAKVPGGDFYGKNIQNNFYVPRILWRDTVEYKVTVNGCLDSSSQITQVYPAPTVDLGSDTMLCKLEIMEFDVTFWNSTYDWQDRNKEPKYTVKRPGLYRVTVTNFCGQVSDSIFIEYTDNNCRMYLPTAFSPNADGLNDTYKPITYDITNYSMRIFNRWGEMVYSGDQNSPGWDGTYRGEVCQAGAYIVQVTYIYPFKDEEDRTLYENVMLNLLK